MPYRAIPSRFRFEPRRSSHASTSLVWAFGSCNVVGFFEGFFALFFMRRDRNPARSFLCDR